MSRAWLLFLMVLISLFLLSCNQNYYTVKNVICGDTIILENDAKVHLRGVTNTQFNCQLLKLIIKDKRILLYDGQLNLHPEKNENIESSSFYIEFEYNNVIKYLQQEQIVKTGYVSSDSIFNAKQSENQKFVFCCKRYKIDQTNGESTEKCNVGTAFFIKRNGYFITAHHLINFELSKFLLGPNEKVLFPVKYLIHSYPNLDISYGKVKLDDKNSSLFVTCTDTLPGKNDFVFGIGYPPGRYTRWPKIKVSTGQFLEEKKDTLFTTLISEEGYSGGPLFDKQGRAIGIILRQRTYVEQSNNLQRNISYQNKTISRKLSSILKVLY